MIGVENRETTTRASIIFCNKNVSFFIDRNTSWVVNLTAILSDIFAIWIENGHIVRTVVGNMKVAWRVKG